MQAGRSITLETLHRLIAGAIVAGVFACATPPLVPPRPVHEVSGAPKVVVVRSGSLPVFDEPVTTFSAQMQGTATLYDLTLEDSPEVIIEQLRDLSPSLVVTLGRKATQLVYEQLPEQPLLFTMVLNYERINLDRTRPVMGIALELPAYNEFAQFKMVAPQVKTVLVFNTTQGSVNLVSKAKERLGALGINLRDVAVRERGDVERTFAKEIKNVDAVWLVNDPLVMSKETFTFLRDRSIQHQKPLFCSLSHQFAQDGALASVSVDFSALGAQAAAMAIQHIVSGMSIRELGVQTPIGTRLVLNLETANKIGLQVPDDVMPFVSDVIMTKTAKDSSGRP